MVTELGMAIKGVLKEELENSIRMQEKYEEELKKFPAGSLIKKKIKGHEYYYVVMREKGKVKFEYKGKKVPDALIKEYARVKELRAKYRKLLSQIKKQIKFLRGALRGQEAI
jgi:nitrogen fixation/metabolism regulation signal transduction histidine kinase